MNRAPLPPEQEIAFDLEQLRQLARSFDTTVQWTASEALNLRETLPASSPAQVAFELGAAEYLTANGDSRSEGCESLVAVPFVMRLKIADSVQAEFKGAFRRGQGVGSWSGEASSALGDATGALDLTSEGLAPQHGKLWTTLLVADTGFVTGSVTLDLWYAREDSDVQREREDEQLRATFPARCAVPIEDEQPASQLHGLTLDDSVAGHFAEVQAFLSGLGEQPASRCDHGQVLDATGSELQLIELVPDTGCVDVPRAMLWPGQERTQRLTFEAVALRTIDGMSETARVSVSLWQDLVSGRRRTWIDGPGDAGRPWWHIQWEPLLVSGEAEEADGWARIVWPSDRASELCRGLGPLLE